jgi:RND family efflux transporter MFP subunit
MKRALLRTLRVVLPLAVLAVAVIAAVVLVSTRPPVVTQPPTIEPPGVRVHQVTLDEVPLTVISQGTVRPRTESQLVSEIAGRVIWVAPSFAEGGFFEADDVLVRIDTFDYEQAIVAARSQLAQARLLLAQEEAEADVAAREWADLGRGDPRELTLRKPQLEDARASVAAAEANLERAERDLERAQIVAPYAGRVRRKDVDVGQFVTVGGSVATIYAVDLAEVRLPLPDEELAYLDLPLSYRGRTNPPTPAVTLRATFAGETHEWEGRIVRTESEIDPVSRMVHVVAEVQDPYAPGPTPNRPPLAVGMYVQAEIEGRTARDVAVVPRAALRGAGQVVVVGLDDRISFRD